MPLVPMPLLAAPQQDTRTILLVDNDYLLAKGTAELLQRRSSLRAQTTDSPHEVFWRCESGEIDMVIMNAQLTALPWQGRSIEGVEIAHRLKLNPRTAKIPIILVSAYSGSDAWSLASDQQLLLDKFRADAVFPASLSAYAQLVDLISRI